jgi:hypothetical protein
MMGLKWIYGCAAMALLFTASMATNAYCQNPPEASQPTVATPRSFRILSPQPEPPDRHAQLAQQPIRPVKPYEKVGINPQPEPPGKNGR